MGLGLGLEGAPGPTPDTLLCCWSFEAELWNWHPCKAGPITIRVRIKVRVRGTVVIKVRVRVRVGVRVGGRVRVNIRFRYIFVVDEAISVENSITKWERL